MKCKEQCTHREGVWCREHGCRCDLMWGCVLCEVCEKYYYCSEDVEDSEEEVWV